jgi:hypothetical protein
MKNKIVLELISKNLEEIKYLFETMLKEEATDPLLIEITTLKARTLYQELKLLLPKDSSIHNDDTNSLSAEYQATDPYTDEAQTHDEPEHEITIHETTLIEEVVTVKETVTEREIVSESPSEIYAEESDNSTQFSATDDPDLFTEPIAEAAPENSVEEEKASEQDTQPEAEPEVETNAFNEVNIEEKIENNIEDIAEEKVDTEEKTAEEEQPDEPDQQIEIITETVTETTIITETITEEKIVESSEKKIFGEQFANEPSLNDKLASANVHESKIKPRPIENIKSAIGINDRFLFTRELFGNEGTRYESAIDQLDQLTNLLEAIEYLEKNFHWTKNDASLKFMNLVKRRFEK